MSRAEHDTLSWRMQALVVLLNLFLIFHVFGLFLMLGALTVGGSGLDPSSALWRWFLEPAFLLISFVVTIWIVARVNRQVGLLVGLVDVCIFLELNSIGMKAVNFVEPFLRNAIEIHDDLPPIEATPIVGLFALAAIIGTFWLVGRIHQMLWKYLVVGLGQQQPPSIFVKSTSAKG